MLRGYQKELAGEALASSDNVLIQADTGAGKTRVLSSVADQACRVLAVAHRNILIKQISRDLARADVPHGVVATKHTRRQCVIEHRRMGKGDGVIADGSSVFACSVDSVLSRYRRGLLELDTSLPWLILVDEAHHMVDDNKWGRLAKIFPHARFIGFTATPCRLDGKSLAKSKGGVFDRLIQAEELKQNSVRTLIEKGHLADFKAYSVPERIDSTRLKLGAHDYTYKSLSTATNEVVYEMAGDAVEHYLKLANGKQALAFCVSIEIAKQTAEKFKSAGIPAAAIHSKLGAGEAARIFDLFERRMIKVLCNVDMIGEGVDVPAIEALIMLRKTASFALYRQWCGRSLRPEDGKSYAILIDHTGNIRAHGLPDQHVNWDLHNPPKPQKNNLFPCPDCHFLVKAWSDKCPECGAELRAAVDSAKYVDVKYISFNLVEIEREKIKASARLEAKEKAMRETLLIKNHGRLHGEGLNRAIHKLKLWVADVLQSSGVSLYNINCFFIDNESNDFYLERFTISDIGKSDNKAIKAYESWQKSQ